MDTNGHEWTEPRKARNTRKKGRFRTTNGHEWTEWTEPRKARNTRKKGRFRTTNGHEWTEWTEPRNTRNTRNKGRGSEPRNTRITSSHEAVSLISCVSWIHKCELSRGTYPLGEHSVMSIPAFLSLELSFPSSVFFSLSSCGGGSLSSFRYDSRRLFHSWVVKRSPLFPRR